MGPTQEQRRTLISSNLTVSADDLTDVGTSVCLTKGIDASSPSSSLLQDIICHLRDIQTASEKLVERSEEQYDKNDQEQEAMLREVCFHNPGPCPSSEQAEPQTKAMDSFQTR